MFSSVATLAKNERRAVVVELAEVMKHKRNAAASTPLATPARGADPTGPDLLQRVPAEDAAAVAALLAPGPRLRRVLEAATCSDSDVRAVRGAADTCGSSHSYILARRRLRRPCLLRPVAAVVRGS
jgi:hypothetical protein